MLIGSPPSAAAPLRRALYLSGRCAPQLRFGARSSGVPFGRLALQKLAEALGHLGVLHPLEAGGGDGGHRRVDAPDHVGAAGGRVLVGRLVEPLDRQLDGRGPVETLPVAELDGGPGVPAAGAGGVEVALLVAAAGEVVLEDSPDAPAQVVAGV